VAAELKGIWIAVAAGQPEEAKKLTQQAIDAGIDVNRLFEEALIGALENMGERWKNGEVYLPEVLMAAEAVKQSMNVIKGLLSARQSETAGRAIIGTVRGDIHDIGKNLVAMMMQTFGFQIFDLGVNVPADRFVEAIGEHGADLLCMSALLSTVTPEMQRNIAAVRRASKRTLIMVGGAPVSQEFADSIGADAFGADAMSAVDKAKQLMRKGPMQGETV
jgi:5-methyltetrahydrofolate--homocysteine methyltransferase